jgi:hypothetical protein
MWPLDRLSRLSARLTVALVLATAVMTLPLAGVIAGPVEPLDTDDDNVVREIELVAPGQSVQPVPSPVRFGPRTGRRPPSSIRLFGLAGASHRPSPDSIGSRLRC